MAQMINTTGTWVPCTWDNTIDRDECGKCHKIPDKIYYRQDRPGSSTGDYWCRECAEITEQPIIEEEA